jgi:hypothetical protein
VAGGEREGVYGEAEGWRRWRVEGGRNGVEITLIKWAASARSHPLCWLYLSPVPHAYTHTLSHTHRCQSWASPTA